MLRDALSGELDDAEYRVDELFGLRVANPPDLLGQAAVGEVGRVHVPLALDLAEAGEPDDVGQPGRGTEHLAAVAADQQGNRLLHRHREALVALDLVVAAVEGQPFPSQEPAHDLG